MSRDRTVSSACDVSERPGTPPRAPPRRRRSALLERNPVFAVMAVALCGWLMLDLWPEVGFFLSSRSPIDLGAPGAYQLERARENRLVQVRGELQESVPVTEGRSGAPRTVGRIAGTNLLVDRPGRGGPPVFEGRLLPASARADYAEAVTMLRERGAPLGDRWLVLRDGERPRGRWLPVGSWAILALIAAVNLRAIVRSLAP